MVKQPNSRFDYSGWRLNAGKGQSETEEMFEYPEYQILFLSI